MRPIKRAVILAAGKGSRLYPYTKDIPKCLVSLDGKTLLDYQCEALKRAGIEEVIIVGGYNNEMLKNYDAKLIINNKWDRTNMVYSLFCAREFLDEDFIVSYGDIIYQDDVVHKLLNDTSDIGIIVDKDWANLWEIRLDNIMDDAESMEYDDELIISSIGEKVSEIGKIMGRYVGLLKFSGRGRSEALDLYEDIKGNENMYMTDFLQCLIKQECILKAVEIQKGWLEVDTARDYEVYSEMIADGSISRFINTFNKIKV